MGKAKTYFISYYFQKNNDEAGFGSATFKAKKINDNNLEVIKTDIRKRLMFKKIVILNIQRMPV